jgi:hypothetical protein
MLGKNDEDFRGREGSLLKKYRRVSKKIYRE